MHGFVANKSISLESNLAVFVPMVEVNDQESQLIDKLVENGWAVNDNWLPTLEAKRLYEYFQSTSSTLALRAATIGKAKSVDPNERRDKIHWLNESTAELNFFFAHMHHFVDAINQTLFLNIHAFEFHWALYEPGAFYKTHYDNFKNSSDRVLSLVYYLNPDWQPEDQGELVLYETDLRTVKKMITPEFNRLAVFQSCEIPHEVKITNRDRLSIVGWLRQR